MFDISFSELLVIAIVALVVIGPEKLPKVARTAGAFLGRLQRFVAQVKEEVNREARFAELQKLQDEVQSSLQQGYDDIAHSMLPEAPVVTPEVEVAPVSGAVKKTRKPRQPKAKGDVVDQAADSPRRRRTATESTTALMPGQQQAAPGDLIASTAPERRARKPRTVKSQPNTDLFAVDEPVNEPRS
ncbi:sec-independent protein translocase protein TatB [Methylophilus rhizosphaerae]|uniref:Sec-independent protein translocase protein TatB n=1 Tax=Methylophilus rhizosphaerae TaxID=492660 RepID=A0A1G9DRE5_9PROT|nr:Sec-independent protein translocase protein TatB [Methylophilus rhizosphaerae]SDK66406.1 sec-independent protein translocase protein TatB [Methylophilus rhizosphaerae]